MTELAFRPGALPKPAKLGRPFEHVPETLAQILDESYTKHGAYEIPLGQGGEDEVAELVRLGRIWCRRKGKVLQTYVPEDARSIWVEMADKRPYKRRTAL